MLLIHAVPKELSPGCSGDFGFGRYEEERRFWGNCHRGTQTWPAKKEGHLKRLDGPLLLPTGSSSPHWQPGYLNEAMRVLQLKLPLAFKYSVVYQKEQSSTGSTVIAL
jgi:hypothetical protein